MSGPNVSYSVTYNDLFSEKWIRFLSPAEWRGNVEVEFREVPFSSLQHAGCCTDPVVVNGWLRTLRAGDPIAPPVAVLTESGQYYLHDGNHRFEALREYFGSDADAATVRVAVAVPKPGYRFQHRWMGEYGTYLLESERRRFANALRAAVAVGLSSGALVATALLPGVDQSPFFVFLMLSVLLSAWFGGWKAGLMATMCNLIGAAYFLLPPNRSLLIESREHALQFALAGLAMAAVALFMSYIRSHSRLELPAVSEESGGSRLSKYLRIAG